MYNLQLLLKVWTTKIIHIHHQQVLNILYYVKRAVQLGYTTICPYVHTNTYIQTQEFISLLKFTTLNDVTYFLNSHHFFATTTEIVKLNFPQKLFKFNFLNCYPTANKHKPNEFCCNDKFHETQTLD